MINKTIFGNRIKTCRLSAGLSQESFAEMCDCSQIFISRIERGVSLPSISLFAIIAIKLNVSMDYLLLPAVDVQDDDYHYRDETILEIYRLVSELVKDIK